MGYIFFLNVTASQGLQDDRRSIVAASAMVCDEKGIDTVFATFMGCLPNNDPELIGVPRTHERSDALLRDFANFYAAYGVLAEKIVILRRKEKRFPIPEEIFLDAMSHNFNHIEDPLNKLCNVADLMEVVAVEGGDTVQLETRAEHISEGYGFRNFRGGKYHPLFDVSFILNFYFVLLEAERSMVPVSG